MRALLAEEAWMLAARMYMLGLCAAQAATRLRSKFARKG